MKCDDVWPGLETGNWWQRRRARRHLERCPSCANAANKLVQFKRLLAGTGSNAPELRMRWMASAAIDPAASVPVSSNRSKLVIGSLATAAAIIVAVVLWSKNVPQPNRAAPNIVDSNRVDLKPIRLNRADNHNLESPPASVVVASPVQVEEVDVAKELLRLRGELVQSETEIRKLAEQAKRRQASAQLELLLADYGRK
jgi:hypothetical protein